MAAQTRQGRYLGGRPPYGYRLADAGPHPNKVHAALGRRAHRLEPDPGTAHVVVVSRHGHTSAAPPDPARPKNAYVREDRILAHLPALHLLLTGTEPARRRRRTRRGADTRPQAGADDVIGYMRDRGVTLTYDPAAGTLQAGTCEAIKTIIRKAG
jgi:hypothetical protein